MKLSREVPIFHPVSVLLARVFLFFVLQSVRFSAAPALSLLMYFIIIFFFVPLKKMWLVDMKLFLGITMSNFIDI